MSVVAVRETTPAPRTGCARLLRLGLFVSALVLAMPSASAERAAVPGLVDAQAFTDLAGEDGVLIEVSLHGALLRAVTGFDPELKALVGGLESIHAVILDLGEPDVAGTTRSDSARLASARALIRETDARLQRAGWERLARVRDKDAEVKVLVLNDERAIQGLAVMVLDTDEGQLIFANLAGVVDLARLQALGQSFDIPGLDRLPAAEKE